MYSFLCIVTANAKPITFQSVYCFISESTELHPRPGTSTHDFRAATKLITASSTATASVFVP
jgi:hypothetical protein